jgi:hypothetical protein
MFFQTINIFNFGPAMPRPIAVRRIHVIHPSMPEGLFQHPSFGGNHRDFQQFMENFLSGGGNPPPPPAAKQVVENLQEDQIRPGGDIICTVCQEEFDASEKATQLPCHHQFHKECLLPWLKEHNTCPTCRFELPTDSSEYNQRLQQRNAVPVSQSPETSAALPIQDPAHTSSSNSSSRDQLEESPAFVRLAGLQSRPHLNGRLGRIVGAGVPDSRNPAVLRFPVQLQGESTVFLLRAENLARASHGISHPPVSTAVDDVPFSIRGKEHKEHELGRPSSAASAELAFDPEQLLDVALADFVSYERQLDSFIEDFDKSR